MQVVLDHFMKHGRTEEEEQKALAQRLQVGRQLYWMLRQHSQTEERRNKKAVRLGMRGDATKLFDVQGSKGQVYVLYTANEGPVII
jgi:hypothetical protein